jgi:hypothetical protein
MRHLVVLFIHLIAVLTQLFRPGGVRSLVAESLLLKHQLLIVNRSRQRSPTLSSWDRILAGCCPRSGLYRESPFRGPYIFPIDRPADTLILRSSLREAFNPITTIRSLLSVNPVGIAILGCRFSERPKKAFGLTLGVRLEEKGGDEHVYSAVDASVFQGYFPMGWQSQLYSRSR